MNQFELEFLSLTPINSNDEENILIIVSMIMGEILLIHPFREGNGRIAKLIAAVLLLQKDYPIPDFSKIKGNDLIDAALDAYSKKYDGMVKILRKALK